MNDRSYSQAIDDLTQRMATHIEAEIRQRLEALAGTPATYLVNDIAEPHLGTAVLDMLQFVKLLALLHTLEQLDVLTPEERDELRAYLVQLHDHAHITDTHRR